MRIILLIISFALTGYSCMSQRSGEKAFKNPVFSSGADPWIVYNNGFYYYTNTSGNNLFIRKAKNLDDLSVSEKKIIWTPPPGNLYSKEIWAPELHNINNKWYMYFAADDGANRNHRIYVVENPSPDPAEGTWKFIGKVSDSSDKWAIDASVFKYKDQLYMVWSGWEGDNNGRQDIYIAKMKNPWTIDGDRVRISTPAYDWETVGDLGNPNDVPHVDVNEGPVALIHEEELFIVYSASGCWTDNYCLGMLTFSGEDNLLDSLSWKKFPFPVFMQNIEAEVFAPGHNSFFKSPDGKEDWIIYHANSASGQGCGSHRSPRAQKFTWNKDGTPDFGKPLRCGVFLPVP